MKVTAVTPAAAASDPAHPDHDRWVKETTLKMEIEHAKRLGLPVRAAEAENARMLERSARIAREAKPAQKKKPAAIAPRKTRQQRLIERAVTIRAATPEPSRFELSPCGRCGTCRRCMRERRILLIIQKAKAGDREMSKLAWEISACVLDAQGGTGRFANMLPRDANRVVIEKAESICDRSVRWLGDWRKQRGRK